MEKYGYVRQGEHCYLRREKETETSFEITMLLQNPLPEMLQCRQQQINDRNYLLYDVTSCKVLGDWWGGKTLQEEELRFFVREVIHVLRECDRHLLDREKVVLRPELIFCDMDAKRYYFLYDPFLKPSVNENLICLAQFLVERANYTQQAAVDLSYRIYEAVSGPNFTIRTLEQCLEYPEDEQSREEDWAGSRKYIDDTCVTNDGTMEEETECREGRAWKPELWNGSGEQAETEKFYMQKAALTVSLLALAAGIYVIYRYELTWQELLLLTGMLVVAVVTAICSLISWLHKTSDSREEKEVRQNEPESDQILGETDRESEKTQYLELGELLTQRGLQGMGQEWQRWISLGSLPCVIGKKEGYADYILQDDSISRMHARFVQEENRIFVVDLHSTNGTFVNGVRLEPDCKVELRAGDQVGFGKLNFTYC